MITAGRFFVVEVQTHAPTLDALDKATTKLERQLKAAVAGALPGVPVDRVDVYRVAPWGESFRRVRAENPAPAA